MKALRFFFLSLLAAFSFAASAQTLEIYKNGRVIDFFSAAQVDSVVYAPAAAQPRYYYYAGWDCPTSVEGDEETSLVKLIETEYPMSFNNTTKHKAGGMKTYNTGYSLENPFGLIDNNLYDYDQRNAGLEPRLYYVVVPSNMLIRDSEDGSSIMMVFDMVKVLGDHTVYISNEPSRNINNIVIY